MRSVATLRWAGTAVSVLITLLAAGVGPAQAATSFITSVTGNAAQKAVGGCPGGGIGGRHRHRLGRAGRGASAPFALESATGSAR